MIKIVWFGLLEVWSLVYICDYCAFLLSGSLLLFAKLNSHYVLGQNFMSLAFHHYLLIFLDSFFCSALLRKELILACLIDGWLLATGFLVHILATKSTQRLIAKLPLLFNHGIICRQLGLQGLNLSLLLASVSCYQLVLQLLIRKKPRRLPLSSDFGLGSREKHLLSIFIVRLSGPLVWSKNTILELLRLHARDTGWGFLRYLHHGILKRLRRRAFLRLWLIWLSWKAMEMAGLWQ